MEKKEADITQMKKLLCSYETAIENVQKERQNPYANRSSEVQQSRTQRSESKVSLETNVYISNLLRKLSLC